MARRVSFARKGDYRLASAEPRLLDVTGGAASDIMPLRATSAGESITFLTSSSSARYHFLRLSRRRGCGGMKQCLSRFPPVYFRASDGGHLKRVIFMRR